MQNKTIADRLREIAAKLDHMPSDRYHMLKEAGQHKIKGHLIILGQEVTDRPMYRTLCSCGKETLFPKNYVDKNVIRDCGHMREDKRRSLELTTGYTKRPPKVNHRFRDYTGIEIGLLLVQSYVIDKYNDIIWKCECACGTKVEMDLKRLHKSRDGKARYRNKVMSCEAQICKSMVKNGFNRTQALVVLQDVMEKAAYR
jgi:hypothetical protein